MKHYYRLVLNIFIILSFSIVHAQNKKGDVYVQLGVSNGYGYPIELTALSEDNIPAVNFGVGYCVNELYHVGFYSAYTYNHFTHDYPPPAFKDVWKGWDIGIKNTFHIGRLLLKNDKLDLYVGAITGYTQRSRVYIPETEPPGYYYDILNYKEDAFTIGALAGIKYFITKRLDLYGEMGFSREFFIGGGVSIKLNKQS